MSTGLPLRRDSAPDGQPRAVRLRRLRTFGLGFLVVMDAAYTASALDMRLALADGTSTVAGRSMHGVAALLAFAMFCLAVGVAWRRRFPVALTIVGLGMALVAQLGPTVALIGLMSVLMWRPRVDAWRLGPLVLLATGVAVWRDLETLPRTNSFWGSMLSLGVEAVPWFVPVVLTLAVFGSFVGVGLWLRTRADLRTAEVVVAEERDAVTSLTDQVSRQAERERLAREIHDGLGHNLSILSVHAGALQAMADAAAPQADTDTAASQIRESAQVVRETAARSVSELHSLLDLLRNPGDADVAAPTRTLRDVRALIDDSVTAGMPL
ncbi:MAG: histidine kinase, partial [Actinomycetes bacterium]